MNDINTYDKKRRVSEKRWVYNSHKASSHMLDWQIAFNNFSLQRGPHHPSLTLFLYPKLPLFSFSTPLLYFTLDTDNTSVSLFYLMGPLKHIIKTQKDERKKKSRKDLLHILTYLIPQLDSYRTNPWSIITRTLLRIYLFHHEIYFFLPSAELFSLTSFIKKNLAINTNLWDLFV